MCNNGKQRPTEESISRRRRLLRNAIGHQGSDGGMRGGRKGTADAEEGICGKPSVARNVEMKHEGRVCVVASRRGRGRPGNRGETRRTSKSSITCADVGK